VTPHTKTGEPPTLEARGPCSACQKSGVPCAVEPQATVVRTRKGQTLTLGGDSDLTYIVRAGVLISDVRLPGVERQVAAVLFPGDMLGAQFFPAETETSLAAASAGEVWRLRGSALEALATTEPSVRRYLEKAITSRMARQAIHTVMLGRFDCEQKLATLFVELALRTGVWSKTGGVAFDMPLGRKDIADYLGLNPDTLSRIMSRFKAARLINQPERSRVQVADFSALAARSPASRGLVKLSGAAQPEAAAGLSIDAAQL
jgi:CRP/FNR family transcriptional regulator